MAAAAEPSVGAIADDMLVPEGWCEVVRLAQEDTQAPRLHALELFGGCGHMSEALVDAGCAVWKFELNDSSAEDFLSDETNSTTRSRHAHDTDHDTKKRVAIASCQCELSICQHRHGCKAGVWVERGNRRLQSRIV
eukprot:6492069-Amphidinium_carterae.3